MRTALCGAREKETFSELCAFWNDCRGKSDDGESALSAGNREETADRDRKLEEIPGITWRAEGGTVRETGDREPVSLDELPFPYGTVSDFRNRLSIMNQPGLPVFPAAIVCRRWIEDALPGSGAGLAWNSSAFWTAGCRR